MPEYPQLARDITALRKRGDVDGAIAIFNNADQVEKAKPELRSSVAWCLYERDIKSCNGSDIRVTDEMLATAVRAVGSVRKLVTHDLYSKFSAYPWSLLATARLMRDHDKDEQLVALLASGDDPLLISSESDNSFPSHRDQWVLLAIEAGKRVLKGDNLTQTRVKTVEPILKSLKRLNDAVGLSNEKPNVEVDGQKKRFPSPRQRFLLQYSRYLQEMNWDDQQITFCDSVIDSEVFFRDTNLKWILYRLSRALIQSNPARALKVCDDFVAMEYRPYALLLRAEILLAKGDTEAALREAAHSLQIISNRDLPFITKNLAFLAELTDDSIIKRDHIQMLRAIRIEQGHPPSPQLEQKAKEMGLASADQAPSADVLRAQWNQINPEPKRPLAVHTNSKKKQKFNVPKQLNPQRERIDKEKYDRNTPRYGEVVFAPIPTAQGDVRRRPVIVIGEAEGKLLVGLLHTQPTTAGAIRIESWNEAGLKQATSYVPSFREVDAASTTVIGRLSDVDAASIKNS
jgi:hypothetical protein